MVDEDLLDRMGDISGAKGDRLIEILNPTAGGDAKRLRDKLVKLWGAGEAKPNKDESVARMNARNTALRLAKGAKPRRPDDPGKADVNIVEGVNAVNDGQKTVEANVSTLTLKPKKGDRHKPGYMAEYMRQRRKKKIKKHV